MSDWIERIEAENRRRTEELATAEERGKKRMEELAERLRLESVVDKVAEIWQVGTRFRNISQGSYSTGINFLHGRKEESGYPGVYLFNISEFRISLQEIGRSEVEWEVYDFRGVSRGTERPAILAQIDSVRNELRQDGYRNHYRFFLQNNGLAISIDGDTPESIAYKMVKLRKNFGLLPGLIKR